MLIKLNKYLSKALTDKIQDDTLGISTCGAKLKKKMNAFLNEQTNIMKLQYGRDKCVKMHIEKKHVVSNCTEMSADSWKEEIKNILSILTFL